MAAGDRRLAATLQALIFVWLLAAAPGVAMFDGKPRRPSCYHPGSLIVIDLGNTNSCVVAGRAPGRTNETASFQFCIPSWVAFTDDGTALVGDAARNHAGADPEATVFGFNRLIGLRRNYTTYEDDIVQRAIKSFQYKMDARDFRTPRIQVKATDGAVKNLSVNELTSMVIAQLKDKAEEYLGRQRQVEYAIMTVPPHFSGLSTQAAEKAGELAGLQIVGMVDEPIAAVVAHGLHGKLREGDNALVLHVGGGTAHASLVTVMRGGSLGVLVYRNDPFLGGDDFDQRTMDYFVKLVKMKHGKDISGDRIALGKLRTACERAKKTLSIQDRVEVTVESLFHGVDFSQPFSRSEFEELNDDIFRRVIELVRRVMAHAEVKREGKNKIDEIVLVGGSTLIPKIQRLVKDYFNGKEPNIMIKPDEAVAFGAAPRIFDSSHLLKPS